MLSPTLYPLSHPARHPPTTTQSDLPYPAPSALLPLGALPCSAALGVARLGRLAPVVRHRVTRPVHAHDLPLLLASAARHRTLKQAGKTRLVRHSKPHVTSPNTETSRESRAGQTQQTARHVTEH